MKRVFVLLLAAAILLCGCGKNKKAEAPQGLNVVTTIFPIYDFVRAVAGEKADIKLLIDPGTEVHTFDPSPSDMMAVYDCDAFFYIGGESDSWVETVIKDISDPTALLSCAENICGHEDAHSHEHNHSDEHIWTSPSIAQEMVYTIAEKLAEKDPENAKSYRENADRYNAEIASAAQLIRQLTEKKKEPFVIIADRNPYTYFFQEFGIGYKAALDGCATSADISLNTMKELISAVREKGVKCAYYTEMSNKKIAEALAQETGIELYQLNSAHNVTADEFKAGVTYVSLMRANAEALEKGWSE